MAEDLNTPDPSIVLDLIEAFRRSKTLFAAVALGVFDALGNGPRSLTDLSQLLRANEDGLERLLDACVGLQLLQKQNDLYRNTDVATTYLTTSSPRRLNGYIDFSNSVLWKLWSNLEDAVREGTHRWKQSFGWDGPIFSHFFKTDDAMREFLMGMHSYGLISSPYVVRAFDLSEFHCLVDVGGGTGHLADAACEWYPKLRAVVFDLPVAVPLAEELVAASPCADRISIQAGDFFSDPLPDGDLYALGRIIHDWTEEKILKLLGRIVDRLPPHGAVLIAEKLLSDDKSGPRWAQLQSLNMLSCTEGKERTLAEYDALLKMAGLAEVHGCETPAPLDAILAFKSPRRS
jgi:acetylserotonin O-methyltransferase